MAGWVQGIGGIQEQISEAQREREQTDIEKARVAFQAREADARDKRLALDQRKADSLDSYRNRMYQAKVTDDPRNRSAAIAARLSMGLPITGLTNPLDFSDVPDELRPQLDTYFGIYRAGRNMLEGQYELDPTSPTGYKRVQTSKVSGEQIGKSVPGVVPPGSTPRPLPQHNISDKTVLSMAKEAMDTNDLSRIMQLERANRDYVLQYMAGLRLPGAQRATFDQQLKLQNLRFAQQDKKTNVTKQEALGSLAVLQASLYGGKDAEGNQITGLTDSVDVLDSVKSRTKLIGLAHQMGLSEDKSYLSKFIPDVISNLAAAGLTSRLTPEEWEYFAQMQRAATAIGGLRNITGKMRPTEALIQRMMRELPDPISTPSSAQALRKIELINREIQAYMSSVAADVVPAGWVRIEQPNQTSPTEQPEQPVDDNSLDIPPVAQDPRTAPAAPRAPGRSPIVVTSPDQIPDANAPR